MSGSSHNRRRLASLAARILVAAQLACQGGSSPPAPSGSATPPPAGSGYADDIAKLCDLFARSGIAPDDPDRTVKTAMWISGNLKTEDARKFLVRIQPLAGAAKADALDEEAHRVGLASCALAGEWRK